MKKVILLALMLPAMASGQIIKHSGSRGVSSEIGATKNDTLLICMNRGDVIISEIMADPNPAVSLPAREYLEIHNRSGYTYDLKDWILSDGNSKCIFPSRIIRPDDFIILCQQQDTGLFKAYGSTIGLKSFPALTDGGKLLFLSDRNRNLVHGVEYSSSWYGDALKDGGGWSLEMIDDDYPFFQEGNWRATASADGGTPGRKNSVSGFNPDTGFDGFTNVFPDDDKTLIVNFSESVFNTEDLKNNLVVEENTIDTIIQSDILFRAFTLKLRNPLETGKIYSVRGEKLTDFASNRMDIFEYKFGIPENVRSGDILFNELLFNSFPGEPDYIEFYNPSGRIINASTLFLVSVSSETGDTSSADIVSEENRCIIPGDYYAITSNKKSIIRRFPSSVRDRIFNVRSLPSMPDDKGHLILFSRSLEKIDEVSYSAKMHFPLLAGEEGVALEKVMTGAPSEDPGQWHSASEAAGWGTPGAPNSVMKEFPSTDDIVTFSSTKITPDNDGFEDLLVINMKLEGMGNVVSVKIFDETGMVVKILTDNMLAGPEASVVWDGTAIDGNLLDTGIYIFLITLFDEKGKTKSWKKVCSVVR